MINTLSEDLILVSNSIMIDDIKEGIIHINNLLDEYYKLDFQMWDIVSIHQVELLMVCKSRYVKEELESQGLSCSIVEDFTALDKMAIGIEKYLEYLKYCNLNEGQVSIPEDRFKELEASIEKYKKNEVVNRSLNISVNIQKDKN